MLWHSAGRNDFREPAEWGIFLGTVITNTKVACTWVRFVQSYMRSSPLQSEQTYKCFILCKFWKVVGTGPEILFWSIWILLRLDREPSSGGRIPVNWFPFSNLPQNLTNCHNVSSQINSMWLDFEPYENIRKRIFKFQTFQFPIPTKNCSIRFRDTKTNCISCGSIIHSQQIEVCQLPKCGRNAPC